MRVFPMFLLSIALIGCTDKADDSVTPIEECDVISGNICTWAGNGLAAYDGEGHHRLEASFYFPQGLTFSDRGKPMIADWNNHKIRMVEDDGTLTTVMGTLFVGDGDAATADRSEAGAVGTDVNLNHPTEQAYLSDGTLLSASWHTHKLRTWDPTTGRVHVVLGSGAGYVGDNYEPASTALMNQPKDVAIDSQDNVYIVDMRNERVRLFTNEGTIVTVAGNGDKGFSGDGGPARDAALNFPKSENPEPGGAVLLSPDESLLYIADTENHRIRVVDLSSGIIDTFAGTGEAGFSGDGGPASAAQLNYPRDLALSPDGHMIVADTDNGVIRSIDLATGTIETIAGTPGEADYDGDGGPATESVLNRPFNVAVDPDGNVYIADTFNHRVRVIWR